MPVYCMSIVNLYCEMQPKHKFIVYRYKSPQRKRDCLNNWHFTSGDACSYCCSSPSLSILDRCYCCCCWCSFDFRYLFHDGNMHGANTTTMTTKKMRDDKNTHTATWFFHLFFLLSVVRLILRRFYVIDFQVEAKLKYYKKKKAWREAEREGEKERVNWWSKPRSNSNKKRPKKIKTSLNVK